MDDLIAFLRARVTDEQAEIEPHLENPYAGLSDDELHQRNAHPAYEYKTLEGQRKAWREVDDPPEGGGWELNTTSVDLDAFERFDYTEERYWRRLRPDGTRREWTPPGMWRRRAAEIDAKRRIIDLHSPDSDYLPDCKTCSCAGALAGTDCINTVKWPCPTLLLLALPYADHPDYREEWRP
ncbi:DUF6221 family protein [Amycolatopsis sp. VS8301801F10]|uniref:DUF6221 family protein n=1 Tax=unclassified Amycolatopsis TaxID=2618356 RepID=UPI0038FCC344